MRRALRSCDEAPILDINTTPLIDVLLVLLIMFIITIPIQTHAVKLDLPTTAPPVDTIFDPIRNKVVITTPGQILWNGVAISKDELRSSLEVTQRMDPIPELHLQPEPEARYELVDEVLAITKRANVRNMGFVGNEQYAAF
ncbi:MAG: ExbD/TolR family protein [Sphingomicrobium sp.]